MAASQLVMLYVRVFHFGSAGKHSLMLCVAVIFVSQLCRIPLGTFCLHHGNCLVSPNGHATEGEAYCCNSSTSVEIASVIFLTYLSCSGHFSLWIEMSCNRQQAALKHHGVVGGSRICSLATSHRQHCVRGREPPLLFYLKPAAFG